MDATASGWQDAAVAGFPAGLFQKVGLSQKAGLFRERAHSAWPNQVCSWLQARTFVSRDGLTCVLTCVLRCVLKAEWTAVRPPPVAVALVPRNLVQAVVLVAPHEPESQVNDLQSDHWVPGFPVRNPTLKADATETLFCVAVPLARQFLALPLLPRWL